MDTLTELLNLEIVIGKVLMYHEALPGIMAGATEKEVFIGGCINAHPTVFSTEGFGPEVLHRAFDPQSGAIGYGLSEVEAVQNLLVDLAFPGQDQEWVLQGCEPLVSVGLSATLNGVVYPLDLRVVPGFGPELCYSAHLQTPRAWDDSPSEGYEGFGRTPEEAVQAAWHGNSIFSSFPLGPCAWEWEGMCQAHPDLPL